MNKPFEEYHKENPGIYLEFKELTLKLIGRGRTYYGANGIIEVIRYHRITKATGYAQDPEKSTDFKVNNNYAPDYARKFMSEYPQFNGFFRTRQLKRAGR